MTADHHARRPCGGCGFPQRARRVRAMGGRWGYHQPLMDHEKAIQARKDLEGGGIYVNNVREANAQRAVNASDLLFGKHLLLRKGKRNYVVLTVD